MEAINNSNNQNNIIKTDLLVIGSGVAGCTAALQAADLGKKVIILSSAINPLDSNSYLAQGGIIYKARNEPDEVNLLSADIQRAGAGKCDLNAVSKLSQQVWIPPLFFSFSFFSNSHIWECIWFIEMK
jgi:aspartate oxidase